MLMTVSIRQAPQFTARADQINCAVTREECYGGKRRGIPLLVTTELVCYTGVPNNNKVQSKSQPSAQSGQKLDSI